MQPLPAGTILIVDDEAAQQRILARILGGAGYQIHTTGSGAAALGLVEQLAPDLVILDVALPDRDGYTVCRQIHNAPGGVPVLFLSAANDSPSKIAAFAAGAVDYVSKPFEATEIIARARTHIELYRLRSGLGLEVAARTADLQAQIEANARLLGELRNERAQLTDRVSVRTEELRLLNERLAEAMRAKDEFLAGMSHELRTPLNAILGLAEMLGEGLYGPLEERQRRAVATISNSGQHLLSLINDILDLAKIEAGREELACEWVAPAELCAMALDLIAEPARAGRVVVAERLADAPPMLWADPRRLRQILVNLLANAVKFTSAGGEVGLELSSEADGEVVRFTVWDTGVGIAEELHERLFHAFAQVESWLDRSPGGTGLGLALVARLARMHGGSVALTSAPGAGSRFSVAVPRHRSTAQELRPPEAGAEVLVLDEYTLTGTALAVAVRAAGFSCVAMGNDSATLDRLLVWRPKAVLVALPVADHQGAQLLPRLRASLPCTTPLIAVGSVVLSGSAGRAHAAGANAYLALPVLPAAIAEMLRALIT